METTKRTHLLGIWPHPDDEAYLSTGLMGRLTDAGQPVTVVTVTGGEKGTADPADYDRPHFARRRAGELRACLEEVGVHDLRLFGYRDGECDLVADESAISAIAAVMADVQPDVVITFGPDGITGHPDHKAVSRWVTEAWRRTGTGELLYATMTDGFVEENAELHEEIGLFAEFAAGPVSVPEAEVALAVELTEAELDRKRRALARHGSQTDALAAFMGEDTYRTWWGTEWFRRPTAPELACCPIAERVVPLPVAEAVAA